MPLAVENSPKTTGVHVAEGRVAGDAFLWSSSFQFYQFNLKYERAVGWDVVEMLFAIAVLVGDEDLEAVALSHSCECYLPAHDELAHYKACRQWLVFGAVELSAVDELSFIVYENNAVGGGKLFAVPFLQFAVENTALSAHNAFFLCFFLQEEGIGLFI